MQVPKRRSEEDRRARQQRDHYLTPEAVAKLRRELDGLFARRPTLAEEVRRTSDMGDRSENAAYQIAKGQLGRMNYRILEIEDQLKYAVVIQRGAGIGGTVQIGSTVVVTRDDREQRFTILGSQESDPRHGRISYRSPLGAALMGKADGDAVSVTVQGRATVYRIVRVE